MHRFRAMFPPFAGRNPHSKFDSVHRGLVQSLRLASHILLKPEELPSHTKRHDDMITSLKSFLRLLCTKIPISMPLPEQDKSPPSDPISEASWLEVSCGIRLAEVGLSKIRTPQVRILSYQRNSLNFKAPKGYQRRLDRLPSTSLR